MFSILFGGRVHIQPDLGKMRITNLTRDKNGFNLSSDLTDNIYSAERAALNFLNSQFKKKGYLSSKVVTLLYTYYEIHCSFPDYQLTIERC